MSRRDVRVSHTDLGRVRSGRRARRRRGRIGLVLLAAVMVLGSVAAIVTAMRLHHSETAQLATADTPASSAVIFVLDGAGEEDLQRANMPNLQILQKLGTSYSDAWVGQLESWEPASSATIGTGLFPRSHGVVGQEWTNTQTGTAATPETAVATSLRATQGVVQAEATSPMVTGLKRFEREAKVLAIGGSRCDAAGAAATSGADYILCAGRDGRRWVPTGVPGHELPAGSIDAQSLSVPIATGPQLAPTVEGWVAGQEDDWIARYALIAMSVATPSLTIITFPEIRELAPYAPPEQRNALVSRLLAGIDADIGRIETSLRNRHVLSRTVFAVTSGEVAAPYVDTVPMASLDEALVAAGAEKGYVSAGAAAQIGLIASEQAQPVAQALQAEKLAGIDAIYYKMEHDGTYRYEPQYLNPLLPAHFADAAAYLLSTVASSNSPDVIAAYAPHTATGGEAQGSYAPGAASGGFQWNTQHVPLILSGRGVTPSLVSSYPARLVDLAPTIAALMGFTPTRVDGTALANAILTPPDGAQNAQTQSGNALKPLISALQDRASAAESQ